MEHPGGTIIPIILSTDKTQITLFRNKEAYPVYMTIGNIPKGIRRKPSHQAYVLLGYIPTSKLEHVKTIAGRHTAVANLYHACIDKITAPLQDAGKDGLDIASGDGMIRHGHPIVAIFVGDYLEQLLFSGATYGKCCQCGVPHDEIGECPWKVDDLGNFQDIHKLFLFAAHEAIPEGRYPINISY